MPRKKKSLAVFLYGPAAILAFMAAALAQVHTAELQAQPVEIKVTSSEFNFIPARVWAVAGRPVTLVLDNSKAETEHGIVVPAFGFRLIAKAGEIARKTAVFDQTGEFEFTCDLPGHHEAGMKGTLIVGRF